MQPSNILSYYPTYGILDEIVSYKNYKKVRIFIDLKNCLQSTYLKVVVENLLAQTKLTGKYDPSIFISVLSFISFHKFYSYKRGLDFEFILFYEKGRSYYHANVDKKYKISRRLNDFHGLDRHQRVEFSNIMDANLELIKKICNLMPNVKIIQLDNLEADFIPYFLITRKMLEEDYVNIIFTNDHDFFQCIDLEDTFLFRKIRGIKKIISRDNVVREEFKKNFRFNIKDFPLFISVVGDKGDDIGGISGIGPKRFLDIYEQLKFSLGESEEIYNKILNKEMIFNIKSSETSNIILKKIIESEEKDKRISRNLKLSSFELISREFEYPSSTEMIERRDKFFNFFNSKSIKSKDVISRVLEMSNIYLHDNFLDIIYL